ncbi:MAG: hypothetical protein KC503_08795 [Myxococcales bacterium]|nr:hypothetical protein [Myxococcales bacterium]
MSEALRIDAYVAGEGALLDETPNALAFANARVAAREQSLMAWPGAPDPNSPAHPDVGWGVVLPDDDALDDSARARLDGAPAALQRLFAARPGAKVLRYRGDPRRLWVDGQARPLVGTPRGAGAGRIPTYLLLFGSPQALPWALQYQAGLSGLYVGRLDLDDDDDDDALGRYVDALLAAQPPAPAQRAQSLVFAVTHDNDPDDITHLMKPAVAMPVHRALAADADTRAGARLLEGKDANVDALLDVLSREKPALVVCSSHGLTSKLDSAQARARLGAPVDTRGAAVDPQAVAAAVAASGAIWYVHACCSGGSDDGSVFAPLLSDGPIREMLDAVGALGARSSPLARALLGGPHPARAFIGHVEPTFNWTLIDNQQLLADHVRVALVNGLYSGSTIGRALSGFTVGVGALLSQSRDALTRWSGDAGVDRKKIAREATTAKLTAFDRTSFVLHGDPAATLI